VEVREETRLEEDESNHKIEEASTKIEPFIRWTKDQMIVGDASW